MWRRSRPQGLSPRLSAGHLIGSSCNRQKANEIFHNLSSCNTMSINELVSGAISHKWKLVQPIWLYTLLLCIHSQTVIGKPSAPKFICTNTKNIWPRVSKELFLSDSEKLSLWHFVVAHNWRYPLRYSGILKCHGYEFRFKKARNLFDRKEKITFMIFISVQLYSVWWN